MLLGECPLVYGVHIITFWKCLYHPGLGALSLDLSTRNVDPVLPILLENNDEHLWWLFRELFPLSSSPKLLARSRALYNGQIYEMDNVAEVN